MVLSLGRDRRVEDAETTRELGRASLPDAVGKRRKALKVGVFARHLANATSSQALEEEEEDAGGRA